MLQFSASNCKYCTLLRFKILWIIWKNCTARSFSLQHSYFAAAYHWRRKFRAENFVLFWLLRSAITDSACCGESWFWTELSWLSWTSVMKFYGLRLRKRKLLQELQDANLKHRHHKLFWRFYHNNRNIILFDIPNMTGYLKKDKI